MSEYSYLDFDLALERRGETYRAWVVNSPAGQAEGEFSLPFTEIELENFILRVGRPRTGTRRIDSAEMQTARRYGQRLFDAVFGPDEVYACFRSSLDTAAQQGKGLRLRLRINAPELNDLPWEYLYNPRLNRFLSLSNETPLVRYLDVARTVQPLKVVLPMRMLVMISSPGDLPQLDVEREWSKLSEALKGMEASLTVDRLEVASLDALQRQLRRTPYHILHFIGHGGFDEQFQDGVLYLEDESGRGRAVNGQTLGTLLSDQRSLRLAVLNACEGARTSQSDPFAGVAQSLVQQGLPAVIAMQFEITDDAAITLAHEFYSALIEGAYPVDAALSEARKAIFAKGNDIEWGTPVYFSRAPDGYIFNSQPLRRGPAPAISESTQVERDRVAAELYNSGLSAYYVKDWERAVRAFKQLNAMKTNFLDTADKLAEAEKQLGIRHITLEAEQKIAAQDWQAALKLLKKLAESDPRNTLVQQQLAQVEKQVQLGELYEDAQRLHQAGQWKAVLGAFERLHELEPTFADTNGIEASAIENLAEVQRQQSLLDNYHRALRCMNSNDWHQAESLLARIVAEQEDYSDAAALLQRTREELAVVHADEQRLEAEKAARKAEADKAAEEKAAALKAESDKAAAEMEAALKMAAEKSAGEKAATEKAERERIEAARLAEQRAQAEKAAVMAASLLAAQQAAARQAAEQKAVEMRAAQTAAREPEPTEGFDKISQETVRLVNDRNEAAETVDKHGNQRAEPARELFADQHQASSSGTAVNMRSASPTQSTQHTVMDVMPGLSLLGIRWQAWLAGLPGGLVGAGIGWLVGYQFYEWSFYWFKDTLNLGYEGADFITGIVRFVLPWIGFLGMMFLGALVTSRRWEKTPPVLADGRIRWLADLSSLSRDVLTVTLPAALVQGAVVAVVLLIVVYVSGNFYSPYTLGAVLLGAIYGLRQWWAKSTQLLRQGAMPGLRTRSSSTGGSMGMSSAWLAALPAGLHTGFWVGAVVLSILVTLDAFLRYNFGYEIPLDLAEGGLAIVALLAFFSGWAKAKTEISRRWRNEPPYLDDGRVRWMAEITWLRAEHLMQALPVAALYAAVRAGLIFGWLSLVYYLQDLLDFYFIDGSRILFYTQAAALVYFLRGWWLKAVALRKKQP